MNVREMIARLQELDPDTEIFSTKADFDYGVMFSYSVKDIDNSGELRRGRIIRTYEIGEEV